MQRGPGGGSIGRVLVNNMWALLVLVVLLTWTWKPVAGQGYYEVVVPNAGISTMHAAVTHYGNVVLLDRTNIGVSQLNLPDGVCRDNPADRVPAPPHAYFTCMCITNSCLLSSMHAHVCVNIVTPE